MNKHARTKRHMSRRAIGGVLIGLAAAAAGLTARTVLGGGAADRGSTVVEAASAQVPGSAIAPQAANDLGMTITAPQSAQAFAVTSAEHVALRGWRGCTTGNPQYVHLKWTNRDPALDSDVFLVPLNCPYGMAAGGAIATGGTVAPLAPATFKVAIVSGSGQLISTITGRS